MCKRIPTFYSPRMVAPVQGFSPSPAKPKLVAEALPGDYLVRPTPASFAQMALAHEPTHLKRILAGKAQNGHGTCDRALAETLPWTCGAMLSACRAAKPYRPAAALCSGFHHAGYSFVGGFCTLNGLMVAALTLLEEGEVERVAIIDADAHYGNGTDDILKGDPWNASIYHFSLGRHFHRAADGRDYLAAMADQEAILRRFRPDLIIYQAGADPHIADPLGGILTTDEMAARDLIMFTTARELGIPIAWNLAGGYQNPVQKVVDLHLQTFRMAEEVYR